jgi:pSer/pThr/pTyr-binding forkhead associated (FHA) protein
MDASRIVILNGSQQGEAKELVNPVLTIGRSDECDLKIHDRFVSRSHAVIRSDDNHLVLQDLRSTAGTTVNGTPCERPTELHDRDVLSFADVEARVEIPGEAFRSADPITAAVPTSSSGIASMNVGYQSGQSISNVAHDQYIQNVIQERQSFAKEIASTKTKARYAVWVGIVLVVAGAVVAGLAWHRFADAVTNSQVGPTSAGGFFRSYLSSLLIAGAFDAVGALLIIVGIVFRVVAASRKKQLLSRRGSPIGL